MIRTTCGGGDGGGSGGGGGGESGARGSAKSSRARGRGRGRWRRVVKSPLFWSFKVCRSVGRRAGRSGGKLEFYGFFFLFRSCSLYTLRSSSSNKLVGRKILVSFYCLLLARKDNRIPRVGDISIVMLSVFHTLSAAAVLTNCSDGKFPAVFTASYWPGRKIVVRTSEISLIDAKAAQPRFWPVVVMEVGLCRWKTEILMARFPLQGNVSKIRLPSNTSTITIPEYIATALKRSFFRSFEAIPQQLGSTSVP